MLYKNYVFLWQNQYNACWYKQLKKPKPQPSNKTLPTSLSILMAAGKIQNTFVKMILSTQQGHAWLVLHLFWKFTFRGHQPRKENTGNQNHSYQTDTRIYLQIFKKIFSKYYHILLCKASITFSLTLKTNQSEN